MAGNGDSETIGAKAPGELAERIENYRREQGHLHTSDAARELWQKGLQAHETDALTLADGGERPEPPDVVMIGMGVAGLSTIFAFLLWVGGNPSLFGWTVLFGFATALLAAIYGTQWSLQQYLERVGALKP